VLEHRVIQVLVALAKAAGGILTRDELTMQCWDGRVVGEDAINRVMSRLRKAAHGIGAGSFDIETISKVGYRLTGDDDVALVVPEERADVPTRPESPTRRAFAVGALAVGVGAIGGGALLYRRFSRPSLPAEVPLLMAQGAVALEQPLQDQQHDAIGAFRRVVEIAPDYAEGWGMLGYAYGFVCHYHEIGVGNAMRRRGGAACARARPGQRQRNIGHGGREALHGSLAGARSRVSRGTRAPARQHQRAPAPRGEPDLRRSLERRSAAL
jgi:DNA-binding winged helix-turn-helix (wHTH) protein